MLKTIAQNSAAQLIALAVSFADRFVAVGVLLSAWGPDLYTDWAALLSTAGLISLGELGLNIYYGNTLQQAWSTGKGFTFQRTISIALFTTGTLALVLGAVAFFAAHLVDVSSLLSINAMPRSETAQTLAFLALATLSRLARGSVSQTFRGRQEFALGTMIDQASLASTLITTIVVGLLGARPSGVAAAIAASDAIAGWGFMLWNIKRRYPELSLRPLPPTMKEVASITSHVRWFAIQQGAPLLWLQLPVLFLSHLDIPAVSLASFLLLRTLVNFMRSVSTMLSIGSAVEVAVSYHKGAYAEAYRGIENTGYGLSIFSAAIAAGLFVFGEELMKVWTGHPEFYDQRILLGLMAGTLIAIPSSTVGAQMMLANIPRPQSLAHIGQIGIGLTACMVLANLWGAVGAAAGLAIGEALGQGILLPMLARHAMPDFNFGAYLRKCAFAMLITLAWCTAVGIVLKVLVTPHSLPTLALAATGWGVVAVIPVLFLSLPPGQRERVLAILRRGST